MWADKQYVKAFGGRKRFAQYQIEFFGKQYDSYYIPEQSDYFGQEYLTAIATYHKDWHQEWKAASKIHFLPARVLAIRVMGVQ